MGNASANENNKFYSPVVELYEKAESRVLQFFNNLIRQKHGREFKFKFSIN